MIESALILARAGLHVFPCVPWGKKPLIPNAHPVGDPLCKKCHGECGRDGHGFYDGTRDPNRIAAWWTAEPSANIGVATGASGLFVVDLDGAEGIASWQALMAEHLTEPTLTVQTPRADGGYHLWFRAPEIRLGNSGKRLGAGIDTRGVGGYVVAPPSYVIEPPKTRPEGAPYIWFDTSAFAPLPGWVIEMLTPKPIESKPRISVVSMTVVKGGSMESTLSGLVRTILEAPDGTRNNVLNWAAFKAGEHIRAGRLPLEPSVAALVEAGRTIGLSNQEVQKTIASGLGAGR